MEPLSELLSQHEGKTLEFKRDLSSPAGVIKTIVAFANGAGGTILIGVEDQTRHVRGVPDPTKEGARLESMIVDRIEPRLVPEIQILSWRKTHLLAVRVFPSSSRPHFVKNLGPEAGTYVRIGSSSRRADPAQIEEIRRFTRGVTFDEEPRPGLNSEAIDFRAASEFFEPIRKLKRSDLQVLGLTARHQRRVVPTNGGVLLFGTDRSIVFPDSVARAGCFAGTDRTEILDTAEFPMHLPGTIEAALHFVRLNTRMSLIVEGLRHEEVPEYPLLAVREAIANAIVHADYSLSGSRIRLAIFEDRLEIDNPGGLAPGLTIDDLRRGVSRLRNRVIGRVFHELRLIEEWGSGVPRMLKACREAGLPEPLFEEFGAGFRVTLFRERSAPPDLKELDQAVLDFVKERSGASTRDIAVHIDRTPRATRTRLRRLLDLGLLVAVGKGPRDPGRVYHLVRV